MVTSRLIPGGATDQAVPHRAPPGRVIVSQRAMRDWSPVPKPWQVPPPDPSELYQVELLPIGIEVESRTPQQEQALRDAAAVLARFRPVPDERIAFFSWMNAADSRVVFVGWAGYVENVLRVPAGGLITFRVTALAQLKNGGPALINNLFIEEYLWANGTLRFVKGHAHPRIGREPSISLM